MKSIKKVQIAGTQIKEGHIFVGLSSHGYNYCVLTSDGIIEYEIGEMMDIYNLTEDEVDLMAEQPIRDRVNIFMLG